MNFVNLAKERYSVKVEMWIIATTRLPVARLAQTKVVIAHCAFVPFAYYVALACRTLDCDMVIVFYNT
jgi:hypothetical protein